METIFAMCTAQGKAGVSVIRVSGPQAFSACEILCGDIPPRRVASLRTLRDETGLMLDQALVLTFSSAASFTGEEVVEFQVHGSIAVVSAVLARLGRMPDLRMAVPGEFTRRALENGCLDLTQIEGLADLIDAETEIQRCQALKVLSGDLGNRAEGWRRDLIRATALLEATIDFADEDVPVDVSPEVSALMNGLIQDLEKQISGVVAAERIRSGFEVAIVGAPNVGKSTLLNALAGRDAAITSDIAGTTRDVIEVRMDLGGLPVTLLDTAGLRETTDAIESIGVTRAIERAGTADLRVIMLDSDGWMPIDPVTDDIVLTAKGDIQKGVYPGISGITGDGIDSLISRISEIFRNRAATAGIAVRARHREAMHRAVRSLVAAQGWVASGSDFVELAAEELRSTIRALDSLVGRVDIDHVLDEIFASFCLGK
ncbi:MAG: tRNA uridine-5-carboxymethylaminomethyl(34) synthesis GTPase MnmE [Rhodobacterales bacterium]|nr:tRNA uridine-5-carboxymethylaminomethyl(34) synthesis GTPase MnmE [Rhodobacterales bacterium]